jgi:hypothetical protein
MLNWFRSKPTCPVDDRTRDWVHERWAWLCDTFGRDRLRDVPAITPHPTFFPDEYNPNDFQTLRALFDRVCQYMGLPPDRFNFAVYSVEPEVWYPVAVFMPDLEGTAGVYLPDPTKATILVEERNLDDPIRLIAIMAHELAHEHLIGHGRISGTEEDHELLTDLLAVFLGFGVILANGSLKEIAWTEGQVSGWSATRQGYLDLRTYGYALALFARMRVDSQPAWATELRADVSDAMWKGVRYLAAVNDPRFAPPV